MSKRNQQLMATHYTRVQEWACSNCGNTGTAVKIVNEEIRTSDCICRMVYLRKVMQKQKFSESNIPDLYEDACIDNWNNPGRTVAEINQNNESVSILKRYASKINEMTKRGIGLYLCGPNGVGKTYLVCSIANRAASAGLNVRYYTMSQIVANLINGWFDDEMKKSVDDFVKSDMLIIDDVDKIYKTKTGIETNMFDNLLRQRLQSRSPCLFTSNRTMDDAKSDYGPHIYSMLSEHCAELVFVGADYRKGMSDKIKKDILGS